MKPLPIVTAVILSFVSCSRSVPPPEAAEEDTAGLAYLPPDIPDEVYAPTDAEDQSTKKPKTQSEEEAEEEAEQAASDAEAARVAPPESTPSPTQAPDRVITTGGVVFVLDYGASDVKPAIEKKCAEAAKDDAEKLAACLQKEREAFQADVLRFKQLSPTDLTFIIYEQKDDDLVEVYSVDFEFTGQTATSVTLAWKGEGMGTRPLFRGQREAVIEVPNTYSIEVKDSKFGRLVYTARYGLAGN